MTDLPIIGLSGSLSSPSRTRALVEEAARRTAKRYRKPYEVIELGHFGAQLGNARSLSDLDGTAADAVERIVSAQALIVASPVYKGSYAGLFKHLIDLLEPASLSGKPILLAATGGGEKHALIIEHQLRPLFAFFEAQTLATGVYAAERDFIAGRPASASLLERLDRAVEQFAPHLSPRTSDAGATLTIGGGFADGAMPSVATARS